VATGRAPAVAAKSTTTTIPIVMIALDPVGQSLVASLARPGGNVTGLSNLSPELNSKRLEILKDTVPKLARVGYLHQAGSIDELPLRDLRVAAQVLKLKLEEISTQPTAEGIQSAFRTAQEKQIDAVMIGGGRTLFAERKRVVELAGKQGFPAIYPQKEYVDEGGLMFYGADFVNLYRRAATYVDQILRGAKPADLPVQQATKFEFIVNLKAGKQIGLTIPVRVLERADRVIK
jgi:putative ABC transport system substrate-binding protein